MIFLQNKVTEHILFEFVYIGNTKTLSLDKVHTNSEIFNLQIFIPIFTNVFMEYQNRQGHRCTRDD
jgi:hypothetical protein